MMKTWSNFLSDWCLTQLNIDLQRDFKYRPKEVATYKVPCLWDSHGLQCEYSNGMSEKEGSNTEEKW